MRLTFKYSWFGWFTDNVLDRGTTTEIRGKVIKQSGRNVVSRLVHAKPVLFRYR